MEIAAFGLHAFLNISINYLAIDSNYFFFTLMFHSVKLFKKIKIV